MCGIVGLFSRNESISRLILGLRTLKPRGEDGVGIATERAAFEGSWKESFPSITAAKAIGHTLHAVVGHKIQPLIGKGYFVGNCEIYNWKELAEKQKKDFENDAEVLFYLLEKNKSIDTDILKELDGVYSFAYWKDDYVWLTRDQVGVKPMWYSHSPNEFAFASERKALLAMGFSDVQELNPRKILCYDMKNNSLSFQSKDFYSLFPEHQESLEEIEGQLERLLRQAVQKRIPQVPYALLFSGGIDSLVLAQFLQEKHEPLLCFVTGLDVEAPDLIAARQAAKILNIDLIEVIPTPEEIEKDLSKIVEILEEATVLKVEIATPLYFAIKKAKERGIKVIFSGMGADELFGGYYRQRFSETLNQDCLSAIRGTYERNTYRDDVISMVHGIELRVPYLDDALIEYSLRIPATKKILKNTNKYILRRVGLRLGIPNELVWRPKKATQYGSKFNRYFKKIAKKKGMNRLQLFSQYLQNKPVRLGALFSTGKDSAFAIHLMKKRGYEIACLITIKSSNPDSYMFHTPTIEIAKYQAKSLNIPLVEEITNGVKEEELEDLARALEKAKNKYQLDGIITGALFSEYQRSRIEKIADSLSLKVFNPLWHIDQEQEVRQLLREGFKIIFTAISAYGLDTSWLGRLITEKDVCKLVKLNKEVGLNVAGEGGEYESLVLDMPGFSHALIIEESEISETSDYSARLVIKKIVFESRKK